MAEQTQLKLTDILELDHLQAMQDAFANVTGITAVLLGADLMPLTRPSNLYGFCEMMQASEKGVQHCMVTNSTLSGENQRTKEAAILTCPHSGLTTAAVPIFMDGTYLGSWLIGQARIKDPAAGVLKKTAQGTGYSYDELKDTLHSLPVFSERQFAYIFDFFKILSETIIKLGRAGFFMKAQNEELLAMTKTLELTAQAVTKVADSAEVGMYVTDYYTGELLMVNEKYAEFMGDTKERLLGRKCYALLYPGSDVPCDFCPRERLLDAKGNPKDEPVVWEHYLKDRQRWIRCTNKAIYWLDGRLAHIVTYFDITDEKSMQQELTVLAYYDKKLLLPNALKLAEDVKEYGANSFFVCFDITALRNVNAVYGRETGDALLFVISKWLDRLEVDGAQTYLLDGDTFCICMRGQGAKQAESAAGEVERRFGEPWEVVVEGATYSISCDASICLIDGSVVSKDGGNIFDTIERTLDVSRKERKVAIFDREMDETLREHVRLEISLKNCVNQGMEGFDVHFQPIVNPVSGRWCGLEALCRWDSPEFGSIPPEIFIREAEQLGLIGKLGFWVLRRAVSLCKKLELDKVPGFFLDVNFSPLQMMEENLATKVLEVLREYDFPGKNLVVEITESTAINFNSFCMATIARLREQDVQVALDDFGTGYSSFNNLKNLPVSLLKTEKAFVDNIETDSYLQFLFEVMINLAHAAGMRLIAEGVENEAQKQLLVNNNVDFIQGFLFSKPIPSAKLKKAVRFFSP